MIERAATEEGMSKHYATSEKFGGQRVSVTRCVCVKYKGDIFMGIVEAISLDGKRPIIRMFSDHSPDARHDSAFGFRDDDLDNPPFADVRTEADIEQAPDLCWFWPLRV
jgi:hypothetical protein